MNTALNLVKDPEFRRLGFDSTVMKVPELVGMVVAELRRKAPPIRTRSRRSPMRLLPAALVAAGVALLAL